MKSSEATEHDSDSRSREEQEMAVRAESSSETMQRREILVIERPRVLSGTTWQIPLDGQYLLITVNHDGKQIPRCGWQKLRRLSTVGYRGYMLHS